MHILESQRQFYDQLAKDYDVAVGASEIAAKKRYHQLFSHGAHYPDGLDLGCGSGNWTRRLLEVCDSVLAVDSSQAMLDLCREKLGAEKLRHRRVDIFSYPPLGEFDVVFSTFWISHVPPQEQENFWQWVTNMLKPNGHIVMQDSIGLGPGGGGDRRRLPSGQEFDIVKIAYDFDELKTRLASFGVHATVDVEDERIYVVRGRKGARAETV